MSDKELDEVVEDVAVVPKIFDFICGTPKQVPITKLHPRTPLKNGTKTLFLNP